VEPQDTAPGDPNDLTDVATTAADAQAVQDVYVAAVTPDGKLLSYSADPPEDDTQVWLETQDPAQAVPFKLLSSVYADGEVDVNLEPEPYVSTEAVTAALNVLEAHLDRIERKVGVIASLTAPPDVVFPSGLTESVVGAAVNGDTDAQAAVVASFQANADSTLAPSAFAAKMFGPSPDQSDPIYPMWERAADEASRWQAKQIAANPRG